MASRHLRGSLRSLESKLPSSSSARDSLVVLVLLCVGFVLRGPTFGFTELDWDESAFALVAREILNNHWPFTTIFDDKSIVLFLHYAAAFALFGDSPAAFRLMGVFVVVAAAALVHLIAVRRLGLPRRWGLSLAICYLLATTGFGGQAVYSEHLINLYALAAALLLADRRPIRIFSSGFAGGLAVNCNYLAILVIGGLIAGHLFGLRSEHRWQAGKLARFALFFGAGAAASTALVLLPVFLLSDPADYFGPQWRFMTGYAAQRPTAQVIADFAMEGRQFLPLAALAAGLIYVRRNVAVGAGERAGSGYYPWLFGGMAAGSVVAAVATGHVWVHYFLLPIPPSILLIASLLDRAGREVRAVTAAVLMGTALMMAVPGLLFTAMGARDLAQGLGPGEARADLPRKLGRMVRPRLHHGDTIYSLCAPLAVYQLTHTVPPTKYPLYPQNLNEQYAAALGLDIDREIESIFAARPAVVLLGRYAGCDSITESTWLKVRNELRRNGYRNFAVADHVSLFELPNDRPARPDASGVR